MSYSAVGVIVTLILSLLAAPLTSQAQSAAHVPRLGLLIPSSVSAVASRLEAFRHGLRDLGYVEGRTIILEYRFADGQADRLPPRRFPHHRLHRYAMCSATQRDTSSARVWSMSRFHTTARACPPSTSTPNPRIPQARCRRLSSSMGSMSPRRFNISRASPTWWRAESPAS